MSIIHSEPRNGVLSKAELLPVNVTVSAGVFNDLGRFIVPDGTGIEMGIGINTGQAEAEGRIHIDLRDTAAAPGGLVNGLVRIEVRDAQDRTLETLYENRTENLRVGAGDRTRQIPFATRGIDGAVIKRNRRIVLQLRPDAAATVSTVNSTVFVDITTYTGTEE